jgi:hypothetical protein
MLRLFGRGLGCGRGMGRGRGLGRGGAPLVAGPGGYCVCPQCANARRTKERYHAFSSNAPKWRRVWA